MHSLTTWNTSTGIDVGGALCVWQLYAPLNIFVALVGIVVWSEKDEIQLSVKGDETLTNFLHYRRVRLAKEHPNDNAQLLT